MDRFEEYRFFAENTHALGERRQTASQTYLTVNSGIVAVLGFLLGEAGVGGWALAVAVGPLLVAGLAACVLWQATILHYKRLIGWRFDQLMAMERAMPDSYQMYVKEWEDFFRPRAGKERFSFSRLELWTPRLFAALWSLLGVGLLAAAAAGLLG